MTFQVQASWAPGRRRRRGPVGDSAQAARERELLVGARRAAAEPTGLHAHPARVGSGHLALCLARPSPRSESRIGRLGLPAAAAAAGSAPQQAKGLMGTGRRRCSQAAAGTPSSWLSESLPPGPALRVRVTRSPPGPDRLGRKPHVTDRARRGGLGKDKDGPRARGPHAARLPPSALPCDGWGGAWTRALGP